jgi:hypothetical protein
VKYVDGLLELGHAHRTLRSTWIVCPDLPHRPDKAMQQLRAPVALADLRLIESETKFLPNRSWETG